MTRPVTVAGQGTRGTSGTIGAGATTGGGTSAGRRLAMGPDFTAGVATGLGIALGIAGSIGVVAGGAIGTGAGTREARTSGARADLCSNRCVRSRRRSDSREGEEKMQARTNTFLRVADRKAYEHFCSTIANASTQQKK